MLRPNASADLVSPASKINPESDAFLALHDPHPGQALSLLSWTCVGVTSVGFLLLPWPHACSFHRIQGDTLRTSGRSHPSCAQNTTETHLTPCKSQSSYKDVSPLCLNLFSLTPLLLPLQPQQLCHSLKIPTLLLPESLCTCCSLYLYSFLPR